MYTPQDREYPAYEPWEFKKAMDLEFVDIRVNEASYKEHRAIIPKHYRTVVRRSDMEGRFKWTQIELEEMAKEYGMEFDDLANLFEQVNCDKRRLREHLEGKNIVSWKKIEDYTLENYYKWTQNYGRAPSEGDPVYMTYQCLLEEKGVDEIKARNKFLGFDVI